MFIKIHGGGYIINIAHIVSVEVHDDMWSLSMVNGEGFDVDEPEEIAALSKVMGI